MSCRMLGCSSLSPVHWTWYGVLHLKWGVYHLFWIYCWKKNMFPIFLYSTYGWYMFWFRAGTVHYHFSADNKTDSLWKGAFTFLHVYDLDHAYICMNAHAYFYQHITITSLKLGMFHIYDPFTDHQINPLPTRPHIVQMWISRPIWMNVWR